jgi:hypothetical protein
MSFVHRDKKAPRNSLLGPDSYSPNRALEDVTFDECGDGLPFDIQASLLLAVRAAARASVTAIVCNASVKGNLSWTWIP